MSEAKYGALADSIATKYGLDPKLFRRLISAESSWNAGAGSPAGARGLTQLMPATARGLGVTNLNDPRQQLEGGAKYLSQQFKTFKGDPKRALAAYNAGPGAVSKYGGVPPYAETQGYVRRILGGYSPGQTSAPGAGAVPPAASPGAEAIQPIAGSLDANKLMKLLNTQRARSLKGLMPTAQFQSQLQQVVSGALPRAQVHAAGQQVGAQVAGVAATAAGAVADRSSAQAINAAKEALGLPYSWGGGTPSGPTKGFGRGANTVGFDCSSLVQMAWAKAGVQLPRTTYDQIKVGHAVANIGQARPGDLLFPSTGHVQLYLGNGQVIEAPRTGGKVQIVPVRSKYIAIRRPA